MKRRVFVKGSVAAGTLAVAAGAGRVARESRVESDDQGVAVAQQRRARVANRDDSVEDEGESPDVITNDAHAQ